MTTLVRSWMCGVKGAPWGESMVMATTRGKAKAEYFARVSDPWPDTKWTEITCRRGGDSGELRAHVAHVAMHRGRPELVLGASVRHGQSEGVIVNAGGGANFEVQFDERAKWPNARLFCHPDELEAVQA